jgi:AcrR family transcriptional regulator
MGEAVKRSGAPPRAYDGGKRREASAETRRAILAAARRLLLERGYHSTTVADIAAAAGVHVDTVYRLVGRKPVLLRELVEQAISGTDRAVPADERAYVIAVRAAAGPAEKIELYARAICEMHGRLAPLLRSLHDAAVTDPEASAVWREISDRRAANMRRFVDDLRSVGGVREGLSTELAADTVWATNSVEVYAMLTDQRGWTPAAYEAWLVDLWSRYLLPGPTH